MTAVQRRVLAGLGGAVAIVLVLWAVVSLGGGGGGTDGTTAPTTTLVAAPTTVPPETSEAPEETTTSTASTSTTSTTTTTTTTTTVPAGPLLLGPEGVGEVLFGIGADEAIAALTALLGPPDDDSGWVDSFSQFGTCPGTVVRGLQWGRLQVLFSDGPTEWGPEGWRHFFAYVASEFLGPNDTPDMATAAGISLGSSVAELQEAYGGVLDLVDDPIYGALYSVDELPGHPQWGFLSGLGPADRVVSIHGGIGCGD